MQRSVSMTTNHLETGVEPTPETSCTSNTAQTMGNVQYSIFIINFGVSCPSARFRSENTELILIKHATEVLH
jgi:hypothetical protein